MVAATPRMELGSCRQWFGVDFAVDVDFGAVDIGDDFGSDGFPAGKRECVADHIGRILQLCIELESQFAHYGWRLITDDEVDVSEIHIEEVCSLDVNALSLERCPNSRDPVRDGRILVPDQLNFGIPVRDGQG